MPLYKCCTDSLSKKRPTTPTSLKSAFCSLLACTVQRPAMMTTRRSSSNSGITISMWLPMTTGTMIATLYVLRKMSRMSLVNSQDLFLILLSKSLLNIWSISSNSLSRSSSSNTIEATCHIPQRFLSNPVSAPSTRSPSNLLQLKTIRSVPLLKLKTSLTKCHP